MHDEMTTDPYESRLSALIHAYTAPANRPIDALAMAQGAMAGGGLRRSWTGGIRFAVADRRQVWLLALVAVGLLAALAVSGIGSRPPSREPTIDRLVYVDPAIGLVVEDPPGSAPKVIVRASGPGSADPACFSSDALAVSWGCWSSAVLSPTGRYVALHSGASSITSVLTLDGREVAQIFDGQDGRARWSPVEDVLAISGGAELDIIDASGTTTSRIPVPAQIKGVQSWSPDGRRVIVKAMDVPELWAVDIGSGDSVRLTNTPTVDEQESAWSPDGSRVAYTSDCGDAWTPDGPCPSSLWTVQSDGSDARRLTPERAEMVAWPIWAPDGSHLAYTRGPLAGATGDGGDNVYAIDADGSNLRQVTTFERGFAGVLGWSPDGSTIVVAYVRRDPATRELEAAETWIMGADGSNPRLLVEGTTDVDEVWAPGQ